MKYSTILTLFVGLFTTQALSSKQWTLEDNPQPPSRLITFLNSEFTHSDPDEAPCDISYEDAIKILRKYRLGFIWEDGKIRGRPGEMFLRLFQFNYSGDIFLTEHMETTTYQEQEKEIKGFQDKNVRLFGGFLARAEKIEKDKRANGEKPRRVSRSADHLTVLPVNKPLVRLTIGFE